MAVKRDVEQKQTIVGAIREGDDRQLSMQVIGMQILVSNAVLLIRKHTGKKYFNLQQTLFLVFYSLFDGLVRLIRFV